MYNSIICRYHEIATKGNNRNMFERCLVDNISHLLREVGVCRVHRVRGRIWVNRVDGGAFSAAEMEAILPQLAKAFGLESFSPAVRLPVEMDAIREAAVAMAPEVLGTAMETRDNVTFRVRARRSNKRFPFRSQEIEIDLVSAIAERLGERRFKLDLDHAEITLGCEVRDEFAALFWNSLPGPGGLPVGSNPRVLTLTFDGELDCDAVVVIKGKGRGGDALMRRTFPLKQEKVGDERFETPWEDPRVEIQFRTNGCVARDFEINVEVAE